MGSGGGGGGGTLGTESGVRGGVPGHFIVLKNVHEIVHDKTTDLLLYNLHLHVNLNDIDVAMNKL